MIPVTPHHFFSLLLQGLGKVNNIKPYKFTAAGGCKSIKFENYRWPHDSQHVHSDSKNLINSDCFI